MSKTAAIDQKWLSYERIAIGSCLVCPDFFPECLTKVMPRDFHDPDHATVWQLLADYFTALPIDQRDTCELWLGIQPEIDAQNAATKERIDTLLANYVAHYSTGVFANVRHACEMVATYAAQSRYRLEIDRLTRQLDSEAEPETRALIANAIKAVPLPVGAEEIVTTASHAENVIAAVLAGKAASEWVCPTGLAAFDSRNGGGLHPGRLYVVAARPGGGKSAMLLQWIAEACRNGYACAIASLEMLEQDLILRLTSYLSGVFVMDRNHDLYPLTSEEQMRVVAAKEEIQSWKLHMRCGSMTAAQFAGWASDLQQRAGVKVVALDYLQRIGRDQKQPKHEAIGAASKVAKDLSLQGLAVIVASQFNREAVKSERPTEDQLGGSDEVSHDADCVISPWRPEPSAAVGAPVGYCELLTLKGRRAVKGRVPLRWEGKTQSFADTDDPSMMALGGQTRASRENGW